jgi:transposase
MLKDDFPQIWVPSGENRDLRQLLWHRHRMVQARTRIMNQLQALALNEGLRCKKRLWREQGRQQLESAFNNCREPHVSESRFDCNF